MSKGPWEKEQKGMEICRMLATGQKMKEIATALKLPLKTAGCRVELIRRQFEARTTYELIAILARNGAL